MKGDKTQKNNEQSKKPGVKAKKVACFTVLFVSIFLLCASSVAVLWAGGWMKSAVCSVVLEDSPMWEKANCTKEDEVVTTEDTGQGEVIDMQIPESLESEEDLVTSIIDQASPAVVTVVIDTLKFDYEKGYVDSQDGIGSGFVVDSDGLIVTNQHVVSDESADYSVLLPDEDEAVPVEKIYRDNTNDIAILKVNKSGLKALKFGDSDEVKRGNLVIAIGSPFGDLTGTATVGHVTGLNRDVDAGSGYYGSITHYEGVIQTDAAINPGNSGGPLLNSKGEIIGVNFATTSGADNVSFAIPINQVKSRLKVFEEEGRFPQPYVGVSYNQRSVFLKSGIVTGAIIIEVEENGPADKADIEKGDIITEVEGKSLAEYSFVNLIQTAEVGEKLEMKIWREGEIKEVEVVVGDKGE
jgi:serine protease Do